MICLSSRVASPQKGINDEIIRRFIIKSSKQHGKWLNGPESGSCGDAIGAMFIFRHSKLESVIFIERVLCQGRHVTARKVRSLLLCLHTHLKKALAPAQSMSPALTLPLVCCRKWFVRRVCRGVVHLRWIWRGRERVNRPRFRCGHEIAQ